MTGFDDGSLFGDAELGIAPRRPVTPSKTISVPIEPPPKRGHGKPETLTGRRDSKTQKAGARDAIPRAGTRRREAYDAILSAGERGLTYDELGQRLGRSYSHIGPRVRELAADGFVERAPFTRTASSGSQQDVWLAKARP